MSIPQFNTFLTIMAIIAVVVFVCLYFVDAGYGRFYDKKWGPSVNNRLGWVLMEAPSSSRFSFAERTGCLFP